MENTTALQATFDFDLSFLSRFSIKSSISERSKPNKYNRVIC